MSGSSKASGLRDMLRAEPSATEPEVPAALIPAPQAPPGTTSSKGSARRSTPRRTEKSPRKRSNVTLSDALVDRISTARDDHRWTFPRLVETALDGWQDLSDDEAEKRLAPTGPRRRQQGINLTERHFEQLDNLGEQWRMNRSEVVTVVLGHQLDNLGL